MQPKHGQSEDKTSIPAAARRSGRLRRIHRRQATIKDIMAITKSSQQLSTSRSGQIASSIEQTLEKQLPLEDYVETKSIARESSKTTAQSNLSQPPVITKSSPADKESISRLPSSTGEHGLRRKPQARNGRSDKPKSETAVSKKKHNGEASSLKRTQRIPSAPHTALGKGPKPIINPPELEPSDVPLRRVLSEHRGHSTHAFADQKDSMGNKDKLQRLASSLISSEVLKMPSFENEAKDLKPRGHLSRKPNSTKSKSPIEKEPSNSAASLMRSPNITKLKGSEIQIADPASLDFKAIETEQPPVPTLAYGLERALFNPGVYHLQDPRSRVYNFDPYLQTIMPVSEFDFNALKQYITSSRDVTLENLAKQVGKRYIGSTSSMTGVLSHFHFLLSQCREINPSMLSRDFPAPWKKFTALQRAPSAIFLKWQDGVYAIDADKQFATSNILSMLGKSMEKLLTLNTDEFERYRKTNSGQISEEERNAPEAYHYSTMGDFLMRSQLDAYDSRLPGTGMFDLKTRAVVSIRMDASNYEEMRGYEIKSRFGEYESYEREYYDMIRSAFLKYSLQVRMGRMDGIFVAFHNTQRIFGFQYIPLEEMDTAIHGQSDTSLGDQEFKISLDLLNQVLDKATKKFPEQVSEISLHVPL